jgi:alkylation response protein AidB-like acyl-CoA dehydrogenase
MARALLGHERTMIADVFKERDDATRLVRLARERLGAREDDGRIGDAVVRDRIAQLEIDQACFDVTLARARDGAKAGHKPGHESSIFKLYGTELNQRRRELFVQVLGPQALGWSGAGFDDEEIKATRDWLRSRGNTIEGGTSEIQLNIIAKRVLGLPGI